MEDLNWVYMMEKMQDIRLFSSLHVRQTRKDSVISSQELDMLSRILMSDEALTPLELTVMMGLSKSAVSRLIERLEKKRLLTKLYNLKDKRSYTLLITEKGNQELEQTYRYYLEPIYKLQRTLGEERFEDLTTQIKYANHMLQDRR